MRCAVAQVRGRRAARSLIRLVTGQLNFRLLPKSQFTQQSADLILRTLLDYQPRGGCHELAEANADE